MKNYNGEPLGENEVLVLMPYDERSDATNVVTVKMAGVRVKAALKAVPKEYEKLARAQFASWQRDFLPKPTEGRCMIPQPDGTVKVCPKRNICTGCPNKGRYERKVIANVSIDALGENALGVAPAADHDIIEEENLTEAQKRIVAKIEAMIKKSPKHGLAMILMAMGYKEDEFADRMHLKRSAAIRVRKQVLDTASKGITNIDQVDVDSLNTNKRSDTEYYRAEAQKALEILMKMYF